MVKYLGCEIRKPTKPTATGDYMVLSYSEHSEELGPNQYNTLKENDTKNAKKLGKAL